MRTSPDLKRMPRRPVRRRSPGRPRRQEAVALQKIYLQAALSVFLSRGYEAASIEAIARAARAGKATFYRRFGGKAELFRLVAHHAISKIRARLQADVDDGGAPEQILPLLVDNLYAGLTDPEYLAVLRLAIAEHARLPELGAALVAHDRYLLGPVVDYLRRTAAAGTLRIVDPFAAAMQLAALASGGGRFLVKRPRTDTVSRAQWIAAVATFALNAWRPR